MMPPPYCAELPLIVLAVTVSVPDRINAATLDGRVAADRAAGHRHNASAAADAAAIRLLPLIALSVTVRSGPYAAMPPPIVIARSCCR